jgi:hypothetical protein
MMQKLIFTTFLSILLIPILGFTEELIAPATESDTSPTVKISGAWIAEAPPTATVLAGYMQLENASDQVVILKGAESQDFKGIEIHETVVNADKVSMVAHETLSVPAGETVSFAPGGFHLMLIGAKKPLKDGDTVEVVLHFQAGVSQTVKMEVKKRSMDNADDHSQHHH